VTGLDGKIAIVLGGAGHVGQSISRALLRAGATAVVPSRSADHLARLRRSVGPDEAGRLWTLEAAVGGEDGAQEVLEQVLGRFGAYDAVVVSLGSFWRGTSALDTPLDVWRARIEENLLTHVVAARTFLPPLLERPGASYTDINGLAAENPRPGSGPISITGAAQAMFVRQLAEENRGAAVRINTVMLGPVRTSATDPAMAAAHPEFISADDVGAFVATLVSDAGAMVHDTLIRLPHRPPAR